MELDTTKQEILKCKDNIIFVEAAAASGKTALLTQRVINELATCTGKVVAFTFTRAAADEMIKRIPDNLNKDNLFIGTIHSYCYQILLSNNIEDAGDYVDNKIFDYLFTLAQNNSFCVPKVESILCDEMQDCNKEQFKFIFNLLKSKRYFCVYDLRQAIYSWRNATPQLVNYYKNKLKATSFYMKYNYRNYSKILEFAKGIIVRNGPGFEDLSIPVNDGGKVYTVYLNFHSLAKGVKKYGDYKSWFVITRSQAQLDECAYVFEKFNIPVIRFTHNMLESADFNQVLSEDKVKFMTIHCAKGLEADNVIVIGSNFYDKEERCTSYVAATRARKFLVWTMRHSDKNNHAEEWET